MRIFLTGGTGFLGSHFLMQALAAGHDVFALRRPDSQPRIRFEINHESYIAPCSLPPLPTKAASESSLPHLSLTRVQWLDGSLTDDWTNVLANCDVLVHLAAAGVNPATPDWANLFRVNVTESLELWLRASDAGVKRFLICGTCFEYGESALHYDFIPPDATLKPTTPYAASKAAATMAALALAKEKNIQLLVARPFHLFGLGEDSTRFWPSLREAALSGQDFPMTLGSQIRDFVPVEQAARDLLGLIRMSDIEPGIPRIKNIGSGKPQSLIDFASFWWKYWQAKGKLRPGELPFRRNEVMRYVAGG